MANNHIWEQWQEGDFITSEALNEIERRIEILSLVEDVFRNQMTVEQFLDMMHITYDNSKDVGMVKHYVKKY